MNWVVTKEKLYVCNCLSCLSCVDHHLLFFVLSGFTNHMLNYTNQWFGFLVWEVMQKLFLRNTARGRWMYNCGDMDPFSGFSCVTQFGKYLHGCRTANLIHQNCIIIDQWNIWSYKRISNFFTNMYIKTIITFHQNDYRRWA